MDFVEKVCKFNEIAGTPNEFNERKVGLYIGLCLEEMAEIIEACGSRYAFEHMVHTLNHWSTRFKEGDFDSNLTHMDKVAALDGFIDTAVVALGGAYSMGADVNGACHEVGDSNLSKYDLNPDGSYSVLRDENGKIKKGPNYQPPNLSPFLK
jgi:predicted HAD superfamily Cof-like phosphohydrolase